MSLSLSNPSQHSPSLFPFENNANYPFNNQFLQLTFNLRKDDRPSAPVCDHSFVFPPPSSPSTHPLRKRKGHRTEAAGSVCRVLAISLKQARHYLGEPDRHEEPGGDEEWTVKGQGQVCTPPSISPQQADPSQTKASVNIYFNPLGSIVFDTFNFWLTSPVRLIKTRQYLAGNPAEAPCGSG